jgi:hypothetical protein
MKTTKSSKLKRREAMKKSTPIWGFIILLVTFVWLMGFSTSANAETMKFKIYNWQTKIEDVPIGDAEGHSVGVELRSAFYVFENGELAHTKIVSSYDLVKAAGAYKNYITMNFEDGSIIIVKSEGMVGVPSAEFKSEIIKGTGRFQGIKGTIAAKIRFLRADPGETRGKGIGEGTITYTLPPK